MTRRVVTLFAVALAIRWTYALVMVAAAGTEGLKIGDSHGYLAMADHYARAIASGQVQGWGWIGPDPSIMPVFTWILTAHVAIAGPWAPLTYVIMQGAIDAGTCVAIFGIARAVDERIAAWSGYAAALTPTLVVLSGVVYSDSIFVFFATLGMLGAVSWLRGPSWRSALLIGFGLGAAAATRVVILAWIPILLLILAAIFFLQRRLRAGCLGQLVCAGAIAAAMISPVILRNASVYGSWSPTAQSGFHLAMWIVPLVREAQDGTLRTVTVEGLERKLRARHGPTPSANPFEKSRRYHALAAEELKQLGVGAVIKAWLNGALINLVSPAVTIVPVVSALPRTGFYDTAGTSFPEKVRNFLFGPGNALYAQLLLAGGIGTALWRLLQLAGLAALLRRRRCIPLLAVLGCWCGYVLLINGPVASPKYRLPIEPVFATLAGAAALFRRRRPEAEAIVPRAPPRTAVPSA